MTDIDTSYATGDRHPSVIRAVSHIGGFEVVTRQYGPGEYIAFVHPLGGPPLFFGLGETEQQARFEAWRYIAGVQRQVEGRNARNEQQEAA